jgi:CO dehydrogenase/acetyl-CoA synthase beta subunit
MRPASSRAIVKWASVPSVLLVLLGLGGFSFAQARLVSSRTRVTKQSLSRKLKSVLDPSPNIGARPIQPPNTSDSWTGGGDGTSWNNASNWNNGIPNSSTVDVTIGTATAAVNDNLNNAQVANLTLSHAADGLTIANGIVLNVFGPTISNAGTITLGSTGSNTELVLQGNVTLSGGGTVTMSPNTNNYIFGAATADTLTNQETIQGAGHIGNGQMTLVNSGTINANQTAAMTIQTSGGTTNTGTIEATAGSTLLITNSGTITNTGGTISANASILNLTSSTINGGAVTLTGAATLQLVNGTIHGGSTLTNSATGTIEVVSSTNTLGGTINNSAGGTFKIDNGAVLDLEAGAYSQLGTLQLNSSGSFTELVLQGNVTLSGGTVTMSNNINNYIFGHLGTDTLTNQETIQGAGHIGNGQMTLVNSGTGIINANQSLGMTLQVSGGVTNTGTIEATGGTLAFSSTTVANAGGTISANANILSLTTSTINGGAVTLTGAATLQLINGTIHGGSTLTNSATGTIEVVSSTNTLGGTINNSAGGTFKIDNGAILDLEAGTYSQLGTVQLNSSGSFTELVLQGNVTLSGGTVTMSNNVNNYLFGAATADTLTNQETIQGAGHIGNGQMTLVNSGTINANQSAGMTLQLSGGATNTGTIEATGGTLAFTSTTVANAGGTISANANVLSLTASIINGGAVTLTGASTLQLNNGTIHNGSTLTNSATGTIEVLGSVNTLGGTINNSAGGTFKIDNGAILDLEAGAYSQLGTLQLNSSGSFTELVLQGNVTLTGGTVTMSNNINNYIFGHLGTDTLTNQETIQGAGHIGDSAMTLVNSSTGIINANQSAGITFQVSGGVTNTGMIEATAGAIAMVQTTVTNAGGTISANANTLSLTTSTINGGAVTLTGASTLQLNSSTIHSGSTLTNSATGTIEVMTGTNTLGGTINNSAGGTFKIDNGAFLDLEAGTYSQLGTVQLNSSGSFTELVLLGNVTLSGGTLTLSNNINNYIYGSVATDILTNQETIQGAGNIGNAQTGLVNSGTINANASNNLVISVSSSDFNNTGTIEATGGTLTIQGPGTTFFTNDNQTTHTLTGGTYIANGHNIQWAAGSGGITTLSANVTEEGGGQLFNTTNSTNALAGLTSITSTGALTIGGVAFVDAGSFSNAGSLTILSGESFTVGSLTQISGGSLTVGTYVLDANLSLTGATQSITTNAATLTVAGGTIENANSTNALANLATNTGKLTIAGTGTTFTTAGTFSNTGTLTVANNTDNFTLGGGGTLAQISGSTLSSGTFVLGGNLNVGSGVNITTNSATLTLEGGTIESGGTTNALAGLAANTKSLTIAGTGTSVSTSAASFSNTGTLTINSSDSFNAAALTQLTGANNNKTLAAGTYVLAGNLDLTTSGLTITRNSAVLTLEGGTINSNNVNALSALATNTGKLTIAGTSNNVSTSAASFSNTGTLTINSGDTFTAPALTQISGSTLSAGTYVLAGNLDLAGAANITTNSAVLTLEGGTIKTGSTNDLKNLSSNLGSLTLASNASFSTVGSFTSSGALTVNKGSKFTVTTGTLTNLSGGTLASGTYTIGGTLQLPTANGGITTNAANLTLTGTAAKINDGSTSALAGFNNNTGTFALAGGATLTTAASSFSNSGTVTVAKGTTMTIGGTGNSYNQTAGTTTVDGTLSAGSSGLANVTGGTIQGAGTLTSANLSVGTSAVGSATINVGDAGKAGLLAITGTYTQLATGNMTGLINGTTAGTGYSQIQVTGTAALAGTINFTVASGFQSSLTLGETFTALTASSVSGTFSNSTIAINATFHLNVSYTATGVVLTVASGPASAPNSSPAQGMTQIAMASAKPAAITTQSKTLVLVSGLRHGVGASKIAKPIVVARWAAPAGHSNAMVARGSEGMRAPRIWERVPVMLSAGQARPITTAAPTRTVEADSTRVTLPTSDLRMGQRHALGIQTPRAGWMGTVENRHVPVKNLSPMLTRIGR